jgi:hypothetical protein
MIDAEAIKSPRSRSLLPDQLSGDVDERAIRTSQFAEDTEVVRAASTPIPAIEAVRRLRPETDGQQGTRASLANRTII